jgi:hypothetical protein
MKHFFYIQASDGEGKRVGERNNRRTRCGDFSSSRVAEKLVINNLDIAGIFISSSPSPLALPLLRTSCMNFSEPRKAFGLGEKGPVDPILGVIYRL